MSPNKPKNALRRSKAAHYFNSGAFALLLTILSITVVHYLTRQEAIFVHVVFRELYFIPIILGGFWFGLKGGLITALIVSLLYLPIAIGVSDKFSGYELGNVLQIMLFNVVGFLIGWLQGRELRHQETKRQEDGLLKIGKAVSYIAHDMKTPLVAIEGFALQIRRKLTEDDNVKQKLDIIVKQTRRLEIMVQDMLNFSKPLKLERKQNCLTMLLEETLILAREKARLHKVHISSRLEDKLPPYSYDYYRLQQALLNLINNAIEASPVDGKVYICCSLDDNGKGISLEIEDSGEGLTNIENHEILEPFVTNKKEGTGLGLPIVKKIVEAHEGTLEYGQKTDRGMIFRMVLPDRAATMQPDRS